MARASRSFLPGLVGLVALALACGQGSEADPATESTPDEAATGPRTFAVHVENVSTESTLALSTGGTAPAPTSPVLWVVHDGSGVLFDEGEPDRGQGLEPLAEEGDPSALAAALEGAAGVASVGAVAVPLGDAEAGPATPGKAFHFEIQAEPGQRLSLAMMFGQSNDLFYAPDPAGIALFDADGQPRSGDVTRELALWDAGTEVNQEPGVGEDQGPRQKAPNTGATEGGDVRLVDDGFAYPPVGGVIKVTVTPTNLASSSR